MCQALLLDSVCPWLLTKIMFAVTALVRRHGLPGRLLIKCVVETSWRGTGTFSPTSGAPGFLTSLEKSEIVPSDLSTS